MAEQGQEDFSPYVDENSRESTNNQFQKDRQKERDDTTFRPQKSFRKCTAQKPLSRSYLQLRNSEQCTTVQLVRHERWRNLLIHLSTEEGLADAMKQLHSPSQMGQNVLHIACRVDPPLCVVQKLFEISPRFARQRDHQLRYPLHVAAASRTAPEVIDYLARKYPKAALMQDVTGKTPLHIACEMSAIEQSNRNNKAIIAAQIKSVYEVAAAICHAAPLSAIVEDYDGATALECALLSMKDTKIIAFLQDVTIRVRTEIADRMKTNTATTHLHDQFPMIDPVLFR